MNKKTTTATTRRTKDWRQDLEGATPEQLAKALLRPIGKTKKNEATKGGP